MPKHAHSPSPALTKHHKVALAGVAALGAAAIAFSAVPSSAETIVTGAPQTAANVAYGTQQIKDVKGTVTDQLALQNVKVEAIAAKQAVATASLAHVAHVQHVAVQAKQQAAQVRAAAQAANRSAERPQIQQVAATTYANNLDGWIRQALDIMKAKGIPGSYNGLHRNIMRESSGNPMAINNWDINAINGIPSKGLLQVIPPTFSAYHVSGTSWNIYNPVANITAAANYAAHRYGSIDNVNSAY
ncbi:transglycosylase-like protein with SLT domain [Streptomyces sp. Ag109_O5-1]|uniref:transglycosylase SLT domain-containing protein n=1 Tax=Streptomyces sp. Ag109_O5-1 TaxID=1938851 RepID=UPI000F4F3EAD|nr:transglycosylase SLT domain-containing protein [Streptomyces sp. Ag109_O5-1]RPE45000.1 transglycosylase-like protein with SLT domain [Streptomyces sp. Ag109_O5-1]